MSNTTSSSTKHTEPTILHASTVANIPSTTFPDPTLGGTVSWKTLLSRPTTATDTFTVGIATCAPSSSVHCPAAPAGELNLHRHAQAELYHVISGRGVVTIDGVEHEVEKGSVVYIPGDAEHGMKCVGEEEVRWLYVFAVGGFGEVEYRFSEGAKAKL
jgi:mannose-6-phosphate isomerase-like protein (cupin superfamily)